MLVALVLGLPVAALAAAVVSVDGVRRDLPTATRLGWTAGVAATSVAGFAAAVGVESWLVRVLLASASPDGTVVVVTPTQVVTVVFTAGLLVSAVAVLAYGFASRYGPVASP